MKHLKTLGLVGMAMALMAFAFAGTASATELYKNGSPGNTMTIGEELITTLEPGTTASLADTAGNPIATCTASEVKGKITNAGSATTTVVGKVEHLTFTGGATCNVTVTGLGNLEIHHIASTDNGTLTGSGFHVVIHVFGTQCTYGLGAATDLGTLTGTTAAGGKATMHIDAIVNRQTGGFLCPTTARWIAKYEVTSPTGVNVRAS